MTIDFKINNNKSIQFLMMHLSAEELSQIRTSLEIHYNMINKAKATLLMNDKDSSMFDEKIERAKHMMEIIDRVI